ncbi:MAG: hypothetical protein BWK80_51540 [Desulfobacteraceae bacterium IS3]|nr:MAG: hypothetical protein BWK80_51540 [Desulfobacteraceae bacterium IS3]HAO20773.1 hypothetical protein [Desulfobacteraceae bacterium]
MKAGYNRAIQILFDEYKRLKDNHEREEILQSIREGIEYLCYPFREDLTEDISSPLQSDDPELTPLKTDLSTVEKSIAFDRKMSELSSRHIQNQSVALNILERLKTL